MNSNLLKSVFLLNPDAIFVEDEKGVIIDGNQRACEIQGIPCERLVGMSIYDLASPERHDEMRVFHQMFWDEEIKTRQSLLAYPVTSYVNDALIHQVVTDDDWGQIGDSVAFELDLCRWFFPQPTGRIGTWHPSSNAAPRSVSFSGTGAGNSTDPCVPMIGRLPTPAWRGWKTISADSNSVC